MSHPRPEMSPLDAHRGGHESALACAPPAHGLQIQPWPCKEKPSPSLASPGSVSLFSGCHAPLSSLRACMPCSRLPPLPSQTMLLERGRVAQQPRGESSFNVFPLMLAGLDAAHRWVRGSHGTGRLRSSPGCSCDSTPIAGGVPRDLYPCLLQQCGF